MMAAGPAAGWYPDPADGASSRWWDGAAWTDHVQPAAVAAVPVAAVPVYAAPAAPVAPPASAGSIPQPGVPSNLDPDGVPLNLFADSVFTPAALAPVSGPTTQEDWHNQGGRGTKVRRQVAGSVSLTTAGVSSKRISNPYQPNWVAGLALIVAVLSIPALALRVAWELPPLTQSIIAGAPIALALLALVSSIRSGARVVVAVIALVVSVLVVVAGFVVPGTVFTAAVDWVIALLPS